MSGASHHFFLENTLKPLVPLDPTMKTNTPDFPLSSHSHTTSPRPTPPSALLLAQPPPFSAKRGSWSCREHMLGVERQNCSGSFFLIPLPFLVLQQLSKLTCAWNCQRIQSVGGPGELKMLTFPSPDSVTPKGTQQVGVGAQTLLPRTLCPQKSPPTQFLTSQSHPSCIFAQDQLLSRNKIGRQLLFLFLHYSS